eukprot:CAMPEP_0204867594 /NCGR_PEP_ID=MMETSP1348-20121228/23394_1 /ASSEMBLY_ACC=CAM_ASM_000700 /TAXON_ID=215587 /ORGANISM="Aplanochytrium stocchinoi, Strain GSBS06" /LENGTH=145 /DNA_ID=CAMNT_0052020115 /DNA_START=165 /DNA_END=602 /DNA_ORIENTATION=-
MPARAKSEIGTAYAAGLTVSLLGEFVVFTVVGADMVGLAVPVISATGEPVMLLMFTIPPISIEGAAVGFTVVNDTVGDPVEFDPVGTNVVGDEVTFLIGILGIPSKLTAASSQGLLICCLYTSFKSLFPKSKTSTTLDSEDRIQL